MGAAITAGIAAGVYQDYGEAIKRTVRIKKTVYPRSEYAEIYEQKYRQYQKVIEALDSVWDELQHRKNHPKSHKNRNFTQLFQI